MPPAPGAPLGSPRTGGAPAATPPAAQPAASAAPVQRVNVDGAQDPNEARRRSTASRIIYGREEIERMGDATVGEILKRLPGVTVGGRPGRGGDPRMRGLGGGYTQILVDGERMPPGFSVDAIEPDQIERIEILRAPVAEFGARAIAGTINIVLREEFKPRQNAARAFLAMEEDRPQGHVSWTHGDRRGTLDYTVTGTVSGRRQQDESNSTIEGFRADGAPALAQRIHNRSLSDNAAAFVSGRWRWQEGRNRWELQPFLNLSRAQGRGASDLEQTLGLLPAPYAHADSQSSSHTEQGRLAGSWMRVLDSGARLLLRGGASLNLSSRESESMQRAADGSLLRIRQDRSRIEDQSLTQAGRYSQLILRQGNQDHSLVAGWELQFNRRLDERTLLDNGVSRLADFGDDVQAATRRLALYVQDEWEIDKVWGINLGLRWEGINTFSDSALQKVDNTSSVATPLAHVVWRLAPGSRDQVRLSLTRSYRTPSTAQLIARPVLSGLYPADGPNQPTSPDRAGNPLLKPEVARGVDLSFERYLRAGGILSMNLYARHIDDLIRNVRTLQTVVWSPLPRWVSSPRNIGAAQTAGIELEARFRAGDAGLPDWPLTVRSNASRFWSRVDLVPGPNNRLDQQPNWTANLGLDWAGRGVPWTWGGNVNLTPAYVVRQIDGQFYEQGRKRVIDGYALWRLSPLTGVRFSVSNAQPLDYLTRNTSELEDGSTQRQETLARTYAVWGARLELKF
ncbi:MAG: TonB-dependent receptor plug domain-containing protein [Burkholderiaceae bacterium]